MTNLNQRLFNSVVTRHYALAVHRVFVKPTECKCRALILTVQERQASSPLQRHSERTDLSDRENLSRGLAKEIARHRTWGKWETRRWYETCRGGPHNPVELDHYLLLFRIHIPVGEQIGPCP
jgi:hypothetical protein